MTEQEQKLLNQFSERLERLLVKFKTIKEEKLLLLSRIEEYQEQIRELEDKNAELSGKYENLKLAKIMSASDEETKDAKDRINKLVREIDKCIALLNK